MDALAVVAGLAVVVLALLPGSGLDASKRAAMVATGLVFGGYGAFVMTQTSGSWSFPAVGFVLPIALGATVVRGMIATRREAAQDPGPASVTEPPDRPLGLQDEPAPVPPTPAPPASPSFLSRMPAWVARAAPTRGPRLVLAGAAVLVLVALGAGIVSLTSRGDAPSNTAARQAAGLLLTEQAESSACEDAAGDGTSLAEGMSDILRVPAWTESAYFADIVERPFIALALRCGLDYGTDAVNGADLVGPTNRAIIAAMEDATASAPEPDPDDQPEPTDGPAPVDGDGILTGGGSVGGLPMFASEDEVVGFLTERIGTYDATYDVSCYSGALEGRQYRWGDFVVFISDRDLEWMAPDGTEMTASAPYVGGWLIDARLGQRTGLRTIEGLALGDTVDTMMATYPGVAPMGPWEGGDDGLMWNYYAGDVTSYDIATSGDAGGDEVLQIGWGQACAQ